MVVRIGLSEAHEGTPVNSYRLRIESEVFAHRSLVKGIVSGRNRGMGCIKAGSSHKFGSLIETELSRLHIFAKSLETCKCSVTFVVVINSWIESHRAEGPYATDTEKEFLLNPVFPVTAIKLMGNTAVFRCIVLKVGIEKNEVRTSYGNLPDTGVHLNLDRLPGSVFVEHRLCRDLEEVLRIVLGDLVAGRGKFLREVTITIKETYRNEIHVHIARFLDIVSSKDSETS